METLSLLGPGMGTDSKGLISKEITMYVFLVTGFCEVPKTLFFFLFGCTCAMWNFLGQEWNLHHCCNQSHSSDNVGSSTCEATRELLPEHF